MVHAWIVLLSVTLFSSSIFSQTRTWSKLNGPLSAEIENIAVSPTGAYYVVAWVDDGRHIMKSVDKGRSWSRLPSLPADMGTYRLYINPPFYTFAFAPDNTIFISYGRDKEVSTLYSSTNEGTTWTKIMDSTYFVESTGRPGECLVRKKNSTLKYRLHADGQVRDQTYYTQKPHYWLGGESYVTIFEFNNLSNIYRTTDGGTTWTPYVLPAHAGKQPVYKTLQPTADGKFIVMHRDNLTTCSIHKGDFASGAWEFIATAPAHVENAFGLQSGRVMSIEPYTVNFPGIYRSVPGSSEMKRLSVIPDRPGNATIDKLVIDKDGAILYPVGDAIFRSNDEGESWEEIGLPFDHVSYVQVDRYGRIFTKRFQYLHDTRFLGLSLDGGNSWRKTAPLNRRTSGYLGPAFDGGVLTTDQDSMCYSGFYIWYFGGIELSFWLELARTAYPVPGAAGGGLGTAPYFSIVDRNNDVIISDLGQLFKTQDKGRNWDYPIGQPSGHAMAAAFSPSWKFYIASQGNIVEKSDDNGMSWVPLQRLPIKPDVEATGIAVPVEGKIFVATNKSGLFYSSDDGQSWTKMIGEWGDSITCLVHTATNEVFFGTPSKGLYNCDVTGMKIVREPLNVPSNGILSLCVFEGRDVYVGTAGSSVWVSTGTAGVSPAVRDDGYQAEVVPGISNSVSIRITCSEPLTFDLGLYDATGRELRKLSGKHFTTGSFIVPLDMAQYSSGVYFVKVTTESSSKTLKFSR